MPELPALEPADFPAFFAALWAGPDGNGPTPFPWQEALVARLVEQRRWPDLVDLPTGSGKTSLLEMAIFLQAVEAQRPAAERWVPRRVILVVDRRVVVDQAHTRGTHILKRLEAAQSGPLASCATRLRSLFDGEPQEPSLTTGVLRGGIVRDESWARRPDVPALISSTVDQAGSRLLFRGYGVSAGMRPLQAGLLAHDCLWLLDEVHLARPFAQTLAAVRAYRGTEWRAHDRPLGMERWGVVELTATPTAVVQNRFPDAPLEPGSHPVLARRLTAAKPARLVSVPGAGARADEAFVKRCAVEAAAMLGGSGRLVAVIVNRVASAREVVRALADSVGAGADLLLLTGRMRPVDRDALLGEHLSRLRMGRKRAEDDRPLILVATQCIEAGADFDLDGIVTECASLDALRQRFGRVDRDGQLSEAGTPVQSVIIAREHDVRPAADDPVYGTAMAATWQWLVGQATIDFGITALKPPADEDLQPLIPPQRDAPLLLPAHLDAWVQTNPSPGIEPDVAHWLHGFEESAADVQVVWRKDMTDELLDHPDAACRRVAACPPASGEALSLSIGAARNWLSGARPGDLADVGSVELPPSEESSAQRERRAVRWTGRDSTVVGARGLGPGDLIVVPSDRGGIGRGSWDPAATEPVSDVATETIAAQRGLAVFRLVAALWPTARFPDLEVFPTVAVREQRAIVREWLRDRQTWRRKQAPEAIDRLVTDALQQSRLDFELVPGPAVIDDEPVDSLVVTVNLESKRRRPLPLELEHDRAATSFTGSDQATLDDHLQGVATWAAAFAERSGLPETIVGDLSLAGRLHDLGKVDDRFQLWLHGGDEVALAAAGRPIAKSPIPEYVRRTEARRLSGYPERTRHEAMSVAMCEAHAQPFAGAYDWDLVLYLIGSHHGYARPFLPIAQDPNPRRVSYVVDGVELAAGSDHRLASAGAGPPDRFWRMVERYGWFGLAHLEALLRLADHRQSEHEQTP